MFQFTGVPPHGLCVHPWVTELYFRWVSPFSHLRIKVCLQLPAAFRSLPRLSSAYGAKAFTLRSFQLDLLLNSALIVVLLTLLLYAVSSSLCGCQGA